MSSRMSCKRQKLAVPSKDDSDQEGFISEANFQIALATLVANIRREAKKKLIGDDKVLEAIKKTCREFGMSNSFDETQIFDKLGEKKKKKKKDGEPSVQQSKQSSLPEDLRWAFNKLVRLASIAPTDPVVILRKLLRNWPGIEYNDVSSLPYRNRYDIALEKIRQDSKRCKTPDFAKAMLAAQAKRQQKLAGDELGNQDEEREGTEETKRLRLGRRVLYMAYSISPRNMFGVLLLDLLFEKNELEMATEGQFVALMKLVTSSETNLDAKGFDRQEINVIKYIVQRLIPGMEFALITNINDPNVRNAWPKVLNSLFVARDPQMGFYDFSLRIDGIVIQMSFYDIIAGNYKTSNSLKPVILSYAKNTMNINLAQHEEQHVEDLDDDLFQMMDDYQDYFGVKKGDKRSALAIQRSSNVPKPVLSGSKQITDEEWYSLDPQMAFWATFPCHVKPNQYISEEERLVILSSLIGNLTTFSFQLSEEDQLHHRPKYGKSIDTKGKSTKRNK